jgi:hypothetical protein
MHSHPLSRLTPISRERLIRRHLDEGVPLKALACEAGYSLRTPASGWRGSVTEVQWNWRINGGLRSQLLNLVGLPGGGTATGCSR